MMLTRMSDDVDKDDPSIFSGIYTIKPYISILK